MRIASALRSRFTLVVCGTLAGLLLLEGVLQIAALIASSTRPRIPRTWLSGGQRMLCLGDSNTFGLLLEKPAEQAYPRQFETLWNAREGAQPIEVLNLGVPGMNSSKLRRILPELLRTLRPDVVTIMVGVNDFWISAVPTDEEAERAASMIDTVWRYSRVFRLASMIRRALQPAPLEVSFPKLGETGSEVTLRYEGRELDLTPPAIGGQRGGWRERLQENLIAIKELVARADARLILLTYPAERGLYPQANAVIRSAAKATRTILVDLGNRFVNACPSKDCKDLFYFDYHPTLRGHELAAQLMVKQLNRGTSVPTPITPP